MIFDLKTFGIGFNNGDVEMKRSEINSGKGKKKYGRTEMASLNIIHFQKKRPYKRN
jgi:hypothetical protein